MFAFGGIECGNHLKYIFHLLKEKHMIHTTKFLMMKDFSLLSKLSESSLNELAKNVTFAKYIKGEIIYDQGSPNNYVYLIEKGHVKVGYKSNDNKTLIKNIVYDHELFGENVFTNSNIRNEFVACMSATTVFKIPTEYFKNLVLTEPNFANKIIQLTMERLKSLEDRVHNFVFKKAKRRIVDFIIQTGNLRGVKIGLDECLINHGMSHKEIAFLTDTSRQTVARVLGELKREEIIHFSTRKPGKILIRNMSA